jgi:hypothetical protein
MLRWASEISYFRLTKPPAMTEPTPAPQPLKQKKKKSKPSSPWRDHLIQGVLIFASVLLAFWLSELRAKQHKRAVVEASMQNLSDELTFNHSQLVKAYGYYETLLAEVRSYDSLPEALPATGRELKSWRGFRMPMIRTSAYETVINSGIIRDFEFADHRAISYIYAMQGVVHDFDELLVEQVRIDPSIEDLPKTIHFFSLYQEVIPGVLASYDWLGTQLFAAYGFDASIASGSLSDLVAKYRQGMEAEGY